MKYLSDSLLLCQKINISKFSLIYPIITLLFFIHTSKINCQTSIAFTGVDTLVDKAIDLFYSQKYFEAIDLCEYVIEKYPDNPMGYLGEAALYHTIMLNYRVSLYDQKFDSLTTLAIETGEKVIKKNKEDEKAYFVLGAAYGFRGLNRIRKGKWFGAFKDGIRGVSNLMKAHELNKELYDVYYGLGLYYYWKSVKAKVLTFLFLMKDEREKGIDYLKIAMEKGRFSSTEAVFALIEIYYYEDRYDQALQAAFSLKENFSKDTTWNYLTAKILGKLNLWEEARHYFKKLLNLLDASPFKSNSYIAECHYGIAKCSYELADYESARQHLLLAFEFSKSWDKEKEIEGPLLDFDLVLKRMTKLHQQLAQLSEND